MGPKDLARLPGGEAFRSCRWHTRSVETVAAGILGAGCSGGGASGLNAVARHGPTDGTAATGGLPALPLPGSVVDCDFVNVTYSKSSHVVGWSGSLSATLVRSCGCRRCPRPSVVRTGELLAAQRSCWVFVLLAPRRCPLPVGSQADALHGS